MIEPGTKVFVRWYGHVVQGEVVAGKADDWPGTGEWVPVLMSIPSSEGKPVVAGVRNICMYHASHVYFSAEAAEAIASSPKKEEICPLEAFKQSHWDHEHNHLSVDALDEFYELWRASIAAKYGYTEQGETPAHDRYIVACDPGTPEGDRSSTYIVDVETDNIFPDVPAPPQDRGGVGEGSRPRPKPKPTRQQMRSTGRIEFADSIQTSLFE